MSAPNCPGCGVPLHAVPEHPYLNSEQWAATKAGDFYCLNCPGKGNNGWAYFWDRDLAARGADRHAAEDRHDQPPPQPSAGPDIVDLVIADLRARAVVGLERYGMPLRAGNNRCALTDAFHEAQDLTLYLRQAIEERGRLAQVALDRINELSGALAALEAFGSRQVPDGMPWPPEIHNARRVLARDEPAEIVAALEAAKR